MGWFFLVAMAALRSSVQYDFDLLGKPLIVASKIKRI